MKVKVIFDGNSLKHLCSLHLVFFEMTDVRNVENLSLREGFKKKLVEFSTKGGGSQR